jgi:iron complex outermembrane receptor protein
MKLKVLLGTASVGTMMALATGTAVAQVAPSAPPPAAESEAPASNEMDDIVVTAQRRAQSLQDVPVAATAVSGQELTEKNISSLLDVPAVAPSLFVTTPYGNTGAEITLRGVGAGTFNKNMETTVATYLDDFVLNLSSSKLGQLFDVSRIEVLRGPQGTLYGKNSTGGAINFISRRPDGTSSANGSLTVARFGTYEVELGAQAPLTDELSVRVSGKRRYSDGYSFNTLTGKHLNNADDWAGRIGIRYKTDTIDAYLKGFFDRSNINGVAYYPAGINANGSPRPDNSNPRTGYIPPADIDVVAMQLTPSHVRTHGATLNVDIGLGDLTLTSVSGYLRSKAKYVFDTDGSPVDFVYVDAHTSDGDQLSQELRLASPDTGAFTWMLGASYFHQQQSGGLVGYFRGLGLTTPLEQRFDETTNSIAAFVDGTYRFSNAFELFAGFRLTHDRKRIRQVASGNFVPTVPATFDQSGKDSWTEPTYRIGLNIKPSNDTLLYASYNRGYRAGAYDVGFITNPAQIARAVDPETVDSFEAGLKTTAFDRRLRLSTAAFYTIYKDQQLAVVPPGGICCSLVNAGKSRIMGVELEGLARFSSNFDLNFSGTILDTKYLEFRPNPTTDYSGATLGRTPKFQLRLQPEFRVPLTTGEIFVAPELLVNGKHRVQTVVDAYGRDIQPTYALINGQLGYRSEGGNYSVLLFVKNATNKRYLINLANVGATSINQTFYAAPRTFGITVTGQLDGW